MDPNYRRILVGSPSSSEAVGSHQNTPETKLTAFSPEELRSGYGAPKTGTVRPNIPPAFTLSVYPGPVSNDQTSNTSGRASSDPFVGPSSIGGIGLNSSLSTNDLPKLSPAATSFTPLGRPHLSLPAAATKHRDEITQPLVATSGPSATTGNLASEGTAVTAATEVNQAAASQSLLPSQADASTFPKVGDFTSDYDISRYLSVKQIALTTTVSEIQTIFNVSNPHPAPRNSSPLTNHRKLTSPQ